jgi:uncharacterized membrane protein YqjE
MSNSNNTRIGTNIVLASILALFSYVPFAYVAKTTLIISVLLFVIDPIPPLTRIVSLVATAVVLLLTRIERNWRENQVQEEEQEEESKKND